ncbi:MAG TPA: 2-C-methyl-D-erythritol 4-phosphate cytidylyltransferase [Tepidisphaeraceae bacterium]|nr:2-C-methyl-D-erythritol 4-phosphate cytidylyltransferase [Tepidisphaeraceae bacterium]
MPTPTFSILILTAPPPGMNSEAGGPFVKIDGREVLLRTVELFLNRDNVKQVQIAFAAEQMEEAKRKFGGHFGFSGVKLISAGAKWMSQIAAAVKTLSPDATHVIVHDGARPAVPYSDIEALMSEAATRDVVGLSTPVKSVLVELDDGGSPMAYHLPSRFVHLVTPQAFSRQRFMSMAETEKEIHASEVTLVKGSPLNQRLSHGGEASFIKAMINMLPKPKIKAPSSPFEEAQW